MIAFFAVSKMADVLHNQQGPPRHTQSSLLNSSWIPWNAKQILLEARWNWWRTSYCDWKSILHIACRVSRCLDESIISELALKYDDLGFDEGVQAGISTWKRSLIESWLDKIWSATWVSLWNECIHQPSGPMKNLWSLDCTSLVSITWHQVNLESLVPSKIERASRKPNQSFREHHSSNSKPCRRDVWEVESSWYFVKLKSPPIT